MIYKLWCRFLTFFGDIYFATEPPKVKAYHIRSALEFVKPGDIICRKYNYYLDSYFIKGKYTHSGIVIDNETMIHAVSEGVSNIDPIDFIKDSDGFIIIRPEYKKDFQINMVIDYAKNELGKPYDFMFSSQSNDAFYCHEFVRYCLIMARIRIPFTGKIIYADDLIKNCTTIYEV